jgi:hypothetical protein
MENQQVWKGVAVVLGFVLSVLAGETVEMRKYGWATYFALIAIFCFMMGTR